MSPKEQYRLRYTMKAEGDDAEVMVYSDIVSEKWWDDEISTGDFDKALKDAKGKGAKNLNIRINSPGGEVYAAVAMRSMVINSGFQNVRVMIEGLCASAATLFATIPGAKVVIAEGSEFMIHNPMTFTWGNADEIEETVDHLRKMESSFHDMYAQKTGQTPEQIKDWMDATTWFTAKEAVEYGFCDELLATEKIAASVSKRDLMLMRSIYRNVPEEQFEETGTDTAEPVVKFIDKGCGSLLFAGSENSGPEDIRDAVNYFVSNGTPVAGVPSDIKILEKEDYSMELENLTLEQLRDANPALLAQIQQEAVNTERERLADIDALTIPGYEEMADQVKADGTSAMDFQKQIVAAMKEQGSHFIQARREETAPAEEIAGGTPTDNVETEEQRIQKAAEDIARYAANSDVAFGGGMY